MYRIIAVLLMSLTLIQCKSPQEPELVGQTENGATANPIGGQGGFDFGENISNTVRLTIPPTVAVINGQYRDTVEGKINCDHGSNTTCIGEYVKGATIYVELPATATAVSNGQSLKYSGTWSCNNVPRTVTAINGKLTIGVLMNADTTCEAVFTQ